VQTFGVAGEDGGSVVNSKTGVPPGEEKVDAVLGDEISVSKKPEDLVPEEELGVMGVEVRDGKPRAVLEENPAGDDGMDVRIPLQGRAKGLDDGDHTRPGIGFVDGRGHHLSGGLKERILLWRSWEKIAARLAPQEGQRPRPLQEKATRNSNRHSGQTTRAKPDSKICVGDADLKSPSLEVWRAIPGHIVEVEKPIIAAVFGHCLGGGIGLVQFSDMCIASEDAEFTFPEARVGIAIGSASSLVSRIPHKIAMELMLTGEPIPGGPTRSGW
jgi:hypothetical protein